MRHDGSPLAYGRSDALRRSCTYVADGEYARLARFERQRLAVAAFAAALAGHHEASLVESDAAIEP